MLCLFTHSMTSNVFPAVILLLIHYLLVIDIAVPKHLLWFNFPFAFFVRCSCLTSVAKCGHKCGIYHFIFCFHLNSRVFHEQRQLHWLDLNFSKCSIGREQAVHDIYIYCTFLNVWWFIWTLTTDDFLRTAMNYVLSMFVFMSW